MNFCTEILKQILPPQNLGKQIISTIMYARTSRSAYKLTLLLGSQKCPKIQDPRINRPLVYRLVSDVADAIKSVPCNAAVRKVCIFCDKLSADHSKV